MSELYKQEGPLMDKIRELNQSIAMGCPNTGLMGEICRMALEAQMMRDFYHRAASYVIEAAGGEVVVHPSAFHLKPKTIIQSEEPWKTLGFVFYTREGEMKP